MLKHFKEFLRLYWVSGLVLVTTGLLLYWMVDARALAFDRDPSFTFDEMLTTLAGVLTTIVVTTFSAVFVALQLASGQFSPRIVRGFFREDWRVQFVLTLFVLCISYCLTLKFLGLTHVRDGFDLFGHKVVYATPGIIAGIFLVLVVFPYFVYYIIRNVNAAKITRNIADRTIKEIERHFGRKWEYTDPETYMMDLPADYKSYLAIRSATNGYLAHLSSSILRLMKLLGHRIFVMKYVGSFIPKGSVLAYVDYRRGHRLYKRLLTGIVRRGMSIQDYRSYTQDINFGIRQLVDIAIKAISPAINDPTTAITCLNYLGDIVREFGQYRIPSEATESLKVDHISVNEFDFDKVVDHSFNQIYFWGRQDPIVVRHMIHVITEIIPHIRNPHNLCVLFKEVEDFELLCKSTEELKQVFHLHEHVHSMQRNYLCRYITAALETIDQVFGEIDALPEPDRAKCKELYGASLQRLTAYRESLKGYLDARPAQ